MVIGAREACGVCAIIPCGPTRSDRISRSQSMRWGSVRCIFWVMLLLSTAVTLPNYADVGNCS
jgi:hypothetical protein